MNIDRVEKQNIHIICEIMSQNYLKLAIYPWFLLAE